IGWILAAAHYDPSAAAATSAVRYGIYTFSIYLPLVMLVVLFLIVSRFDIEGKYAEMMAQIKARNEAEAAAE
ncbi:MAG: sugar (glycoside-pentoside-Hexuronide) transporter, partial [Oscillospiraceae bacterium]|nr:sugar (glycoside-pentoside-Hexuronide) transporter [Oscillospiraceae bacterium]